MRAWRLSRAPDALLSARALSSPLGSLRPDATPPSDGGVAVADALDSYCEASLLKPDDDALTERTANLCEQTGDASRGIDHLTALLKKAQRPTVLFRRAKLRIQVAVHETAAGPAGDKQRANLLETACQDLSDALKGEPLHAEALLCRACLEANVGPASSKTRRRALDDLNTCIELLPDDPRPCMARGMTFESSGVAHEAIAAYLEAARRARTGLPLVAAALVYLNFERDHATAIYCATRAINAEQSCTRAYLVRAECFHQLGDHQRALRDTAYALGQQPDAPLVRAMHARLLLASGKLRLAGASCWSLAQMWAMTKHAPPPSKPPPTAPTPATSLLAAAAAAGEVAATPRGVSGTDAPPTSAVGWTAAPAAGTLLMAPGGGGALQSKGAGIGNRGSAHGGGGGGGGGGRSTGRDAPQPAPATTAPTIAALRNEDTVAVIELMAECAIVLDKPLDGVALLRQLTDPPTSTGRSSGAAVPTAPPVTPLQLSLLAAAWQAAGELARATVASARALRCLSKATLSPAESCIFWTRRGHLLLALHRPVHALDAYRYALESDPTSHAATEALLWAQHLSGHGHEAGEAGAPEQPPPPPTPRADGDPRLGTGGPGSRHTDLITAAAYEQLALARPKCVRTRLHRAHLMWRRGDLHAAGGELAALAKLTDGKQPRLHGIVLAFSGLVHLHTRQHGTAIAHLVAALKQPLSPPARQLVLYARGTSLHQVGQWGGASDDLSRVKTPSDDASAEATNAATAAAAAAAASAGGTADGELTELRRLMDEDEVAATRAGLQTRQVLASASAHQLGFCAAFTLGLSHWASGRPVASLTAFLAAQRCCTALAAVHTAYARAEPPGRSLPPAGPPAWHRRWPVAAQRPLSLRFFAASLVAAGHALHRLHRLAEAEAHYEAAMRLDPEWSAGIVSLGDLKFNLGELREARRAYCHAMVLCPASVLARVHLGRLLHHSGDEEGATRMIAQALAHGPTDAEALEASAVLQLARGELPQARDAMEAALSAPNAPPTGSSVWKAWTCTLAALHARLANRAEAVRLYVRAAESASSSALALSGLAALQLQSRQWAAAASLFEASLEVLDADADCFSLSSSSLSNAALIHTPQTILDSQPAASQRSARPPPGQAPPGQASAPAARRGSFLTVATAPTTEYGSLARANLLRGRAALGAGVASLMLRRLDTARRLLNQAVALRPDCGRTLFDRAVLHMVSEQWDLAEKDLVRCLKRLPMLSEAWLRKSKAIAKSAEQHDRPQASSKRQVLIDYANVLMLLDWKEEQAASARRAEAAEHDQQRVPRGGEHAGDAKIEQSAVSAVLEEEASAEPSLARGLRDKFGNRLDHSGVRAPA